MNEHGHPYLVVLVLLLLLGIFLGGQYDREQDERIDALETRVTE